MTAESFIDAFTNAMPKSGRNCDGRRGKPYSLRTGCQALYGASGRGGEFAQAWTFNYVICPMAYTRG